VWINLFAFGGLEATFFWPVIGGLYWKKGNSKACLASVICGLAVFIFFNRVKILPLGIHEIIAGLIVSGIAYFVVGSLCKEEPDAEMIKKCF
jgi:sodium/pantothenate symporter